MARLKGHVAALDFGASSGRVMVGEVGPDSLRLRQFARFENRPLLLSERLHWDVEALWAGACAGLAAASRATGGLVSVASDTWGVDYGVLQSGKLLANPSHYREWRTQDSLARVSEAISPQLQFRRSGVEISPINTIYQLAADVDSGALSSADRVLLMSDLFTYWLSGREIAERTIASTTGLLDAVSGAWSTELIAAAGFSPSVLPEIVEPGTRLGPVRAPLAAELGLGKNTQVVAVGSHDTASAVVATPLPADGGVFVSLGTWGLVGMERSHPELTETARLAGFTNESGVDGRSLLMRNTMGMWLLSESLRTWERAGRTTNLRDLLGAAQAVALKLPTIDVNDPVFATPGDIPGRIEKWCLERGLVAPKNPAETVRLIIESLAESFAEAARETAWVARTPITQINVVGGGSLNELLCQRLADLSGVPVYAGPVEATALGNALVQARAMGLLDGTLDELRELVRRTHQPSRYEPRQPAYS